MCVGAYVCVCAPCMLYLEHLDGVDPVGVRVLPRFALREALGEHVQIEDDVVLRVGDLALKQLHDAQESLQGAADINNYKDNNREKR